jgi:hypothetical protein
MKCLKKIGMAAVGVAVTLASANAFALASDVGATSPAWIFLDKVTRVTVRGDYFMVEGTNSTGYPCSNESNYYGPLNHHASEPGHNAYYAMALAAQLAGRGMQCHVTSVRAQSGGDRGVCVMTNCNTP